LTDVRFGSKADMCAAKSDVRFTPNSDRQSGFPRKVMSALPPKADMCSALAHVCFGPKADIACRLSFAETCQPILLRYVSHPSILADPRYTVLLCD
jgi:hypothetical protein